MKQRGLGEETLVSLSERGSLAFQALEDIIGKEYGKGTLGNAFDAREKDASSRSEDARGCTERIHAHAAELSVDQNKSIINFDALSSAFNSKAGQTTFANQKGIFTPGRVQARVEDDNAYPMHDVNNPETYKVLVVMQAWVQYAKSLSTLVSVNATNPEQELAALREYVQNPKNFLRGKEKIEPTSKKGKWVQVLDELIKSGEISADNLSYQFESTNIAVGVDILSAGLLNEANAAIIGSVNFNATRPRWKKAHVACLKSQSVEFQAKVEAELAKWERDGKRRESIAAGARVFNFSLIEETKVHSDPTDKDKKKAMRFPRDAKYEALRKAGMGGELVLNTAERTKKGNSKKKTTVKEKFKASGLPRSTKKFNLKPEAKQSNPLKSLWESHAASKKKKNPPTQSDDEE
jgi:hypothetical protein